VFAPRSSGEPDQGHHVSPLSRLVGPEAVAARAIFSAPAAENAIAIDTIAANVAPGLQGLARGGNLSGVKLTGEVRSRRIQLAIALVSILALGLAAMWAWQRHIQPGKFLDAVRDDDWRTVKSLLHSNPDLVFTRDGYGQGSPFNTVTIMPDQTAVFVDGFTPLHWAALRSFRVVADLLLSNKADVNARDRRGRTPLHWAAAYNHVLMERLLLAHGAEVNVKDGDGLTPLAVCKADYVVPYEVESCAVPLKEAGGHR